MLAPWAVDEMRAADLEDRRLNERLTRLLSDLGERPTASIPAACGGYNELMAAYRFFDNEKATPQKILEPHAARTRERMARQPVVLLVQDTTELDLTRPQQQVVGAGPLEGSSRPGALVHLQHAFTPDGTPLGTLGAELWTRDEGPPRTPEQKQRHRKQTPIEEKESRRWRDGLRQAQHIAGDLPGVQCISVCDSEADIYELFAEPRGERPLDVLIRAGQDRALLDEDGEAAGCLRAHLLTRPVLFTNEISIRRRQAKTACETRARRRPRESRTAEVEVRAAQVTLRPPQRPAGHQLPPVTLQVVLVREIDPPAEDDPVEWLLLTTLPIDTAEQVRTIIAYYTVRWMVEVLFRTLKSGCRVEERRFEHLDRLLPCVAVYLIVAWRTLFVCRMGRSCPDIDCEAVFEPAEWKSVWMVTHRQPPPEQPPTLGTIVRLIAGLGGYVYRAHGDPPGPQTVWLGLQRTRDLAWGWNTFGPGRPPET